MVIEKESDRPALKLCGKHELIESFWIIYDPALRSFVGARGFWVEFGDAVRFTTIDKAKEAIRELGCGGLPAFVEHSVVVHFDEGEA